MESLTTRSISIKVIARYETEASGPNQEKFVFSYQVTIENKGLDAVQLLDRHWIIVDADNVTREVKGPGVIGLQPVIEPGDHHTYNSWSVLRTSIGKMTGYYGMHNMQTGESFQVKIPTFKLIADFVKN